MTIKKSDIIPIALLAILAAGMVMEAVAIYINRDALEAEWQELVKQQCPSQGDCEEVCIEAPGVCGK